jgi:HEAT repeat protein
MAKARTLDDQLASLRALESDPASPAARDELRRALASKNNHLVAKAAQIVGENRLTGFDEELVAAFDRFMVDAAGTDKSCAAKIRIAEALLKLEAFADTVFIRGVRHVQPEPVYGGRADSAPPLRAACALGLVQIGHPDTMLELAHLLADREPEARGAAARALGATGRDEALSLLRFKCLTGDENPAVLGECFAALLSIAPRPSLPFVAEFLGRSDEALAETAGLALGASRLHEAFEPLKAWWSRSFGPMRRAALTAVAMLRHDAPLAFLVELARDGSDADALDAIAALAMYKFDESLKQRLAAAVARRKGGKAKAAFAEAFGS